MPYHDFKNRHSHQKRQQRNSNKPKKRLTKKSNIKPQNYPNKNSQKQSKN